MAQISPNVDVMDPKTPKIEEFPKKNDGVGQKLTLFLANGQLFSSAADRSDLGCQVDHLWAPLAWSSDMLKDLDPSLAMNASMGG